MFVIFFTELTERQKDTNYAKSLYYQDLAVQRDLVKASLDDETDIDNDVLDENGLHDPSLLDKLMKCNFPYLPLFAKCCTATGAWFSFSLFSLPTYRYSNLSLQSHIITILLRRFSKFTSTYGWSRMLQRMSKIIR